MFLDGNGKTLFKCIRTKHFFGESIWILDEHSEQEQALIKRKLWSLFPSYSIYLHTFRQEHARLKRRWDMERPLFAVKGKDWILTGEEKTADTFSSKDRRQCIPPELEPWNYRYMVQDIYGNPIMAFGIDTRASRLLYWIEIYDNADFLISLCIVIAFHAEVSALTNSDRTI